MCLRTLPFKLTYAPAHFVYIPTIPRKEEERYIEQPATNVTSTLHCAPQYIWGLYILAENLIRLYPMWLWFYLNEYYWMSRVRTLLRQEQQPHLDPRYELCHWQHDTCMGAQTQNGIKKRRNEKKSNIILVWLANIYHRLAHTMVVLKHSVCIP